MSFDQFLTDRGMQPIGPAEDQKDPAAELSALERDLEIPPSPADIETRLQAVKDAEADRQSQVKKLELSHYIFRKATEAGLPPEVFDDLNFTDQEAIDMKINQIKELTETVTISTNRKNMIDGAHRPMGSGETDRGRLTLQEHISAAEHRVK